MKVLTCHTYYQQRGGEDQSYDDEVRLLRSHGIEVVEFTKHNDTLSRQGRILNALNTVWNRDAYRELRAVVRREKPDVAHFTNLFPLLSPAVLYAASDEGVPVVQSLRNYRLICPAFSFLRDGQVCEECLGKMVAWPAVRHGCYRGSRSASAVVAAMLATHRLLHTSRRAVSLYYTLTEFARSKLIAAGVSPEKIAVKTNFVSPDPGPGVGNGGFAIFVGRLSQEKGVDVLLDAWERFSPGVPLRIYGDGPLTERVQAASARCSGIEWRGNRPLSEVYGAMQVAALLVCPSIWYETFGRVIAEAYAAGTPVVVSRMGAMQELVDEGRTGLTFTPGDASDLARAVAEIVSSSVRMRAMRAAAREAFERRFTAEENLRQLLAIYARAMQRPQHASLASEAMAHSSAS